MTQPLSRSLFAADAGTPLEHKSGHILIAGASGTGKTGFLTLLARAKLKNPLVGLHVVDPDGELSPKCLEFIANPRNGAAWRTVHYLRAASTSEAFALPLLHVPDRAPQPCHEAAVRARTVFEQVLNFGAGDYGPRLSKLFHLGCFGLALTGRPLIDLPELFTLGAAYLRQLVGEVFPYQFLSEEWRSLDVLGERNPSRFLEYTESISSRLMPIFGNERLRRIYGPQKPIDVARMLAHREVVLLDLAGLEHKDAVLVGTSYISLLYHEALQRPPNEGAHATVIVDEVFDYLTPDMARGFDRLRKRNIQLCVAIQRLGQLKSEADRDGAILNAIITNTRTKVCFGSLAPDDAEFMARIFFTGFVDLCEWKVGSERPVAVGQEKTTVRSSSRALHEAQHQTHAVTRSHSHGEADGTMSSTSTASGEFSGMGESAGMVMSPPMTLLGPNAPGASMPQMTLSESAGDNNSRGSSEQSATSSGESHVSIDTWGEAETHGSGSSRGTSVSEGESECFITRYEWMPSQMYSLQEQQHRLIGELMNLPLRECFVKLGNNRPFRTRTADLTPAFRSDYGKRVMLPIFLTNISARSPYLLPVAEIDAAIAARSKTLIKLTPPEPDISGPEPLPIIDAPEKFAQNFWKGRSPPSGSPKPKPKRPPGRRPLGDLRPEHDRFGVIEGDGDKKD